MLLWHLQSLALLILLPPTWWLRTVVHPDHFNFALMAQQTRRSASASIESEPLIGFPSNRLGFLPKEILGVETRVFNHEAPQPATNPDLTVWALMNALKTCSSRVLPLLSLEKVSLDFSTLVSSVITRTADPRVRDPRPVRYAECERDPLRLELQSQSEL